MRFGRRKECDHQDRQKLAHYLGARNTHRFMVGPRSAAGARKWRRRLILFALLLLCTGLSGVWLEFTSFRKMKRSPGHITEESDLRHPTELGDPAEAFRTIREALP